MYYKYYCLRQFCSLAAVVMTRRQASSDVARDIINLIIWARYSGPAWPSLLKLYIESSTQSHRLSITLAQF